MPFMKNLYPHLGWLFVLWVAFVIVAMSNAVNLTDGLDGLAIGTTVMVAICYTVLAYIVARPLLARYLLIPAAPGAGEVAVLLGCFIGAAFGFLWFNAHPAEVFMGDVGSLAIGGLLGGVALMVKAEMLLVIAGGIFVIEAASSLIQSLGYKLWKVRVFRMAPIHHHFEKIGLHESKIIARFYVVGALLALFGLATLKLR
jgi:phospho-N-acetylmuramoyl-pentapeptide-transferase